MTLEGDIDILRRVPFFSGLPAEPLKLLAFSADARELADGSVLFRAGDPADEGHVVMEGRIELVRERDGGRQVLERLGPATLIGELALIVGTERPATAVASGRTRVLSIRRPLFRRMLTEYPDIAVAIRDQIAARLGGLAPEIGRIHAIVAEPSDES